MTGRHNRLGIHGQGNGQKFHATKMACKVATGFFAQKKTKGWKIRAAAQCPWCGA